MSMSRICPVFLYVFVIAIMIGAGCSQSTSPSPLMTPTGTPAPAAAPSAPVDAGTFSPAAAGTTASASCTADTLNDAANCGGCGFACPANAVCQAGQCSCRAGFVAENNRCVLTLAGNANTPTMAATVPATTLATATTTTALPTTAPMTTPATVITTTPTTTISLGITWIGFNPVDSKWCYISGGTICNNTCVNLSTSPGNCGSCGTICSGLTATCCNGECVNLKNNWKNCGTCGHKCSPMASCEWGSCKPHEDI